MPSPISFSTYYKNVQSYEHWDKFIIFDKTNINIYSWSDAYSSLSYSWNLEVTELFSLLVIDPMSYGMQP